MFDRYKTESAITRGNAIYLAERIGAEHVQDNRIVFNMLFAKLFEGYQEGIRQPIDNNWRRLPYLPELFAEAEKGFRSASVKADEIRLDRLRIAMTRKAYEVFISAAPRLQGIVEDPVIVHDVVTALMERRHRLVVETGRQDRGLIGNYFADARAETLHREYLTNVPNGHLMDACAGAAFRALRRADSLDAGDAGRTSGLENVGELVRYARTLGGSDNDETWKLLSHLDGVLERETSRRPTAAPGM